MLSGTLPPLLLLPLTQGQGNSRVCPTLSSWTAQGANLSQAQWWWQIDFPSLSLLLGRQGTAKGEEMGQGGGTHPLLFSLV